MNLRFWRKPAPVYVPPPPSPDPDVELLDWLESLPESEARAIRCDAGWTQREVATHVGVTAGSVSVWERKQAGWSRYSGLRYARLLRELEVMRDESVVNVRNA